jgi:hypothetical protein
MSSEFTWEGVRLVNPRDIDSQIQKEVDFFFNSPIQIHGRLFQTLRYRLEDTAALPPFGLWKSAFCALPQLAMFLEQNGVSLRKVKWDDWPSLKPIEPDFPFSWFEALRSYFPLFDNDEGPPELWDTQTVLDVKRTGQLTTFDCLLNSIESPDIVMNSAVMFLACTRLGVSPRIFSDSLDYKKPQDAQKPHFDFALSIAQKLRSWISPDPSFQEQQFLLFFEGDKLRVQPFGAFVGAQLDDKPLPDGSLWIARGNVLQPSSIFADDALSWLEDLVNKKASESDFQTFFEAHPEFMTAIGNYRTIHPHLILHEDSGNRLVPDFFLEKMNSTFCDICDLKRAHGQLVRRQPRRVRFRDSVMEAVAQLEHYRNWFDDKVKREEFKRRYGLNAFRPRIVLIIGRRESFYDEFERSKLESSLPQGLLLATYDDILDKAKQWRRLALTK